MAAAPSSDATGEAVRGLAVGSGFPDLELPDHAGNTRRLSELAGEDPVLLTFYRGWWCPKEQAFFRQLVRFQDEVEVAYTRMVSVSVDPPEVESAFRAGLGARWTFLSDAERRYLDELELRETTDTSHNPYMPAAFVLRPDLEIASAYAGYWFWGRPTLAELHRDLREVTRAVRDQWLPPS
ncbi:MAG TPA: redoxin domain-containing protein [Gaiella sp.]|nr:redoxin domain-containing protein [Gaiella sp.]